MHAAMHTHKKSATFVRGLILADNLPQLSVSLGTWGLIMAKGDQF